MTDQTEAMRAAQTIIVNIAAQMAQGGIVPSHYREDYKTRITNAMLGRLERADEQLRGMAAELKRAYDMLGQAALASKTGLVEVDPDKMVDRFLSWELPDNFNPDGGVSFLKPKLYRPRGTNLLDATMAKAMVYHMLGIGEKPKASITGRLAAAQAAETEGAC